MSNSDIISGLTPFASLAAVQAAHEDLLQRRRGQGDTPEFLSALDEFIRRGHATGVLLEALGDRRVAQGLLNFWANTLYRAGVEPPDATLSNFDPSLAPELDAALCPYRGLDAFGEADHELFFGRWHLVTQLVEQLRGQHLLALVGPSGSGKSSLVRAGIIPALRSGALPGSQSWRYLPPMVPGSEPLVALAQLLEAAGMSLGTSLQDQVAQLRQNPGRLVELADRGGAAPIVLVVDQFEEVFRLCDDEGAREAFINNIIGCIQGSASGHIVVLTMRSDFETYVARAAALQPLFEQARVQLTPLSAAELREAIEKPAERVGLKFERGVVDALVRDILGEPAGLPLLQFTLLKLWDLRDRNRVTWRAYERVGGGRRALARSADELYARLIPEEQVTMRRILLRIVRPGEGLEVTSSRLRLDLLYLGGEARERVDRVLETLLQARLLRLTAGATPADSQVEVAHEALIRNWPQLVEWLDEERVAILTRRRLEARAAEWIRLGRGRGGLLDAEELREAEVWLASPQAAVLGYDPSIDALVLASRRAIRRAARVRFALLSGLFAAMAVALVLAIVAYYQAQQLAAAELSRRQQAEQQARVARLNQLAAQSQSSLDPNPQRSLLVAIEALSSTTSLITPTVSADPAAALSAQPPSAGAMDPGSAAAEEGLWRALGRIGGRSLTGHTDRLTTLAVSPNSHWLATGSADRTVRLWDLTAADPAAGAVVLGGHTAPITQVVFSADNYWLATTAGTDPDTHAPDTTIELWNLTAGKPTALLLHDHTGPVTAIAFSPDGRWLISGGDRNELSTQIDTVVRVWNLSDLRAPPRRLDGHRGGVTAIAVSSDSRRFVTTSKDNTAIVWSLADPNAPPIVLQHGRSAVMTAAMSPDGRWLITGSADGTTRRWDLAASDPGASPLVLRGHTAAVDAIALSADGAWLATGSADHTVRRWHLGDTDDPAAAPTVLHGHDGAVVAVALTQDGRWLATASDDGTARLWDLAVGEPGSAPIVLSGGNAPLRSVAISSGSRWLAAGGEDDTILLWDAREPRKRPSPLTLQGHSGIVDAVTLSSDERWLASGGRDKAVRLWNLAGDAPSSRGVVLQTYAALITALAISPDSHWLVAATDNPGLAHLWDLSTADPAAGPIELLKDKGAIRAVAISADSRWLAAGGDDRSARIWNLANPAAAPRVLSGHQQPISSIAISPDSRWAATGSQDATARLWDLAAPDPSASAIVLRGHTRGITIVAFSPDNRWLATGSADGTTRLWKLDLPDPSAAPIVLGGHGGDITAVAFSPDNRWLATTSVDGTARLWDLGAPDPAIVSVGLYGHEGAIVSATISADGHWLITAGRDGTVRLWTLRLAELLDQACRVVGRNLSAVEWRQSYPDQPYRKTCASLPTHRTVILEMLSQARSAALEGDSEKASRAYRYIVEAATASNDVVLSNIVCWRGSTDGYARIVLPACDRAVALSPDAGLIRDSRGLARALIGDSAGAIEDFTFAVDWAAADASYERFRAKRQGWIDQLRSGQNPFDDVTRQSLRDEPL